MTISSVFSPRTASGRPTFWGEPTSSVNWCEKDYTFTIYIAEFFNTTSSLFMVSFGILGAYTLKYLSGSGSSKHEAIYDPVLENRSLSGISRIRATWYALQLVGWGSVAFHGSLQWWAQALDEAPMVWTAILHMTTLLCGRYDPFPIFKSASKKSRTAIGWKGYLIPSVKNIKADPYVSLISATLLGYCILASLLVTVFRGPSQFLLFHVLFATAELAGFYYTYKSYTEVTSKNGDNSRQVQHCQPDRSEAEYKRLSEKHHENVRKLHNRGVLTYLIAVLIWSTDLNFCPYVSQVPLIYPSFSTTANGFVLNHTTFNPQGHAWWHFLVSAGFYHVGVLATYDRVLAGYRCFWEGVDNGDEDCLALLSEEKANGRRISRRGDTPVVEWKFGLIPIVKIQRIPAPRIMNGKKR